MALQLAEGEALSEVASAKVLAMAAPELRHQPLVGWTKPVVILTVLMTIVLSGLIGYRAVTASAGDNSSSASCHVSGTP
jgi:hypothetical protein